MSLYQLTIHELNDKLLRKEISATEIAESVCGRIDQVEGKVNAFLTITREAALARPN